MNFAGRTLVEAVPGPAAIVDPDGRVLIANRLWALPDSGSAFPAEGTVLAGSADPCPGHTVRITCLESASGSLAGPWSAKDASTAPRPQFMTKPAKW